jgi:hypothetical protein
VEAFDRALRLRVSGVPVFLGDAQTGQEALEVVVAVGESRGVDRSVVGKGGCRQAVVCGGGGEAGHDVGAAHVPIGGGCQ